MAATAPAAASDDAAPLSRDQLAQLHKWSKQMLGRLKRWVRVGRARASTGEHCSRSDGAAGHEGCARTHTRACSSVVRDQGLRQRTAASVPVDILSDAHAVMSSLSPTDLRIT